MTAGGPVRGRVRRAAAVLAAAAGLLAGTGVTAQPAPGRLLVMDLPYAEVWAHTVRAVESAYPIARAEGGVIESARVERAPRADEVGLDRVAERVTVRVEPVADRVTRVTVDVQAEGLRGGAWERVEGQGTTQALLARIRAAQG